MVAWIRLCFFGFSFKWPDDPGCKKTETREGEDGAGRLRPFVANSLASLHTAIGSTRANHTGITNSKLCSHRGRTTAFLGSFSFYLKSTALRKPTFLVNQTRTSVLHLVPKCQTAVMKQLFPVRLKVEDGFIKSSIPQEWGLFCNNLPLSSARFAYILYIWSLTLLPPCFCTGMLYCFALVVHAW